MILYHTRWLLIALAFLPLAAPGAPPAAIKLTSQLTTSLDMSVEINEVKGRLMVDSGAMFTVLDKSIVLTMLRYAANSEVAAGFFHWALPVKIANKAGIMIVDTGCESTMVSQNFAKLAGIESMDEGLSFNETGGVSSKSTFSCALPDFLLNGKLQLGKIHGGVMHQTLSEIV